MGLGWWSRRDTRGKRGYDGSNVTELFGVGVAELFARVWRGWGLEAHEGELGGFGAGVERLGPAVGDQVEALHYELADQGVGALG